MYAIKHPYSEVTWADGTKIVLPPISRSQNGWVYRPQEAIGRGTGKSFGKGTSGDNEAKAWLTDRIHYAFARKDWEIPVQIPEPDNKPHIAGDTVSVGWKHPVWGYTWIEMAHQHRTYYSKIRKLTLTLHYHALAEDIAKRQISFPPAITKERTTTFEFESDQSPLPTYEKFRADPWGFTKGTFGGATTGPIFDLIQPHRELPPVDYSGQQVDEDDVWYKMVGNVDLLFSENAQRVVLDNMKLIDRVTQAFAHLGFEIRIGTPYNSKVPNSLTIVVPSDKGKGRGHEEPHTIEFTPRGINIKCGYVENEQRYVDYQQRSAIAFLEDVFEEEWTQTETQL